jgi:hypothetical protein
MEKELSEKRAMIWIVKNNWRNDRIQRSVSAGVCGRPRGKSRPLAIADRRRERVAGAGDALGFATGRAQRREADHHRRDCAGQPHSEIGASVRTRSRWKAGDG